MSREAAGRAARVSLLTSICPGQVSAKGPDIEASFGGFTTAITYQEDAWGTGSYQASITSDGPLLGRFEDNVSAMRGALDLGLKAALLFHCGDVVPREQADPHLQELGVGWGVLFLDDPSHISFERASDAAAFNFGLKVGRETPLPKVRQLYPHLELTPLTGVAGAQVLLIHRALLNGWTVRSTRRPNGGLTLTVGTSDAKVTVTYGNADTSVDLECSGKPWLRSVPEYLDRVQEIHLWGQCAQIALCSNPRGLANPGDAERLARQMGTWAGPFQRPSGVFKEQDLNRAFQEGVKEAQHG